VSEALRRAGRERRRLGSAGQLGGNEIGGHGGRRESQMAMAECEHCSAYPASPADYRHGVGHGGAEPQPLRGERAPRPVLSRRRARRLPGKPDPNTEAAIDLTAASPLMFAWRIAGRIDRRAIGF
jgi:hypothetical protein